VSTTDPLGNTTTFGYDAQGDLATVSDPLGNTTRRAYDAASRLTAQTDPRGFATSFAYDPLNRLTQIADAQGGLTAFSYDGNGNLLTVTDARGNATTHTYDSMDRLATRTDPVGAGESFQYDGVGNLLQHTDRKGQVATFGYDALNRRTGASYADGSTTTFAYDAAGRLVVAADSVSGTIENAYDALDRLVAQSTGLGTLTYAYDALGRRTLLQAPGVNPVTYAYDAASRLTAVTQVPLSPVTIAYDAVGRRTLLTLPNGVGTEYEYDAASRLTALIYRNATGLLGDLRYQYDPAGNRLRMGGSFARTLLPDPVATATYDAANRQLAFGDKAMTFDANGNVTAISDPSGLTSLDWDARDRLVALTGPGTSAAFAYDVQGRRLTRQSGGQLTQYLYDGLDVLAEVTDQGVATYLRTLTIDEPLARNGMEFYTADALGSALTLTDSAGALATRYTYAPFGRTAAEGVSSGNPFQYTGRENDGLAGLYYYRARYYHPSLQRFISEDPIGFEGGDVNLYSYVANNPLTFADPLGLDKDQCPPGGRGWRLPDFVSASASVSIPTPWTGTLLSWTGSVVVDRYGNWYWSPIGPGAGRAPYIGSGSLTANWLVQGCKPTQERLNDFLSGHGFTGAAGWWGGGNVIYSPGNGAAVGGGLVSPQAGGNYSYSFRGRGNTGWSW